MSYDYYADFLTVHPEKFGLETVIEADDPRASYSFDTFIVLRDVNDGQLFYVQDSGCSCPTPFEGVTSREDLTAFSTWDEIVEATKHWLYEYDSSGEGKPDPENEIERQKVLRAVAPLLPQ